jgi:Rrf2 family protein
MFQSKSSVYALLAVLEVGRRHQEGDKGGVKAGQLAAMFGLPPAYAAKVMSQLARAKVLRSERGPRGGYRLYKGPEHVTLLHVIEAVHGLDDAYHEAARSDAPRNVRRGLGEILKKTTAQVRTSLSDVSIADFLDRWPMAKSSK